eukprot:scaffold24258_cov79-Phaeocystis_antarctica.AAC.2
MFCLHSGLWYTTSLRQHPRRSPVAAPNSLSVCAGRITRYTVCVIRGRAGPCRRPPARAAGDGSALLRYSAGSTGCRGGRSDSIHHA